MILSSTSPYALLKEFSIACGFKYDAVFAFVSIISVNGCRKICIYILYIYNMLRIEKVFTVLSDFSCS